MRRLLLAIAVTATIAATAYDTRRRNLTADTAAETAQPAIVCDTITPVKPHDIDINGYDKPLRSRRESFFVTNNGKTAVKQIALTISYYDTQQRMLHRSAHRITTDIPAGQTRQITLPAWDKQGAFYYINTTVKHRAEGGQPYDVRFAVDTLFVSRPL